eukprot:TRINITY_DN967_c0_g2_i4.p1 TRINITY_DN967_c0_g2~~TRINITY_DN967_c0_g2_i4.p1  ORF type:complete len:679 (+),score=186.18 TRINITY_DN967_c0_g2_i4:59-2095(+)
MRSGSLDHRGVSHRYGLESQPSSDPNDHPRQDAPAKKKGPLSTTLAALVLVLGGVVILKANTGHSGPKANLARKPPNSAVTAVPTRSVPETSTPQSPAPPTGAPATPAPATPAPKAPPTHDKPGEGQVDFVLDTRPRHTRPAEFRKPPLDRALEGTYITLWLQQVHAWFKSDGDKARAFVQDAKAAGFAAVMTDVPWSWTEREAENDLRFDTFGKDWVKHVCEAGLKLHLVLRANERPPWLEKRDDLVEATDPDAVKTPPCGPTDGSLSMGSDEVVGYVARFFEKSVKFYVETYGDCIESFNPTMNNELEARFITTFDCMRDFSAATLKKYGAWQQSQGFDEVLKPLDRQTDCKVHPEAEDTRFWEFRNVLLGQVHARFCAVVAASGKRCLLHIGEFFASSDRLNGNALHLYLDNPNITDFTMDSNMALTGAASSPSVVGMMTDAARRKGKIIHYEAATERILPCNDEGEFTKGSTSYLEAAKLLYREGIARGLESGVETLGFTNLCKPLAVKEFLGGVPLVDMKTAQGADAAPDAVLYVPSRLFGAHGIFHTELCQNAKRSCWHDSFAQLPKFGVAKFFEGCTQDAIQYSLLEVWDSLRLRHARVQIVMDARQLSDAPVAAAGELVAFLTEPEWGFHGGEVERALFEEAARKHGNAYVARAAPRDEPPAVVTKFEVP